MTMILSVTERACAFIQTKLAAQPGHIFRVTVKKTGCSGFSYAPAITDQQVASDVIQTIHGVNIYIDKEWVALLQDVAVDYVEDNKSGIKQKKLVFINPKESSRCGCGESFHLA